jgi:hypothetical protein
MSSVNLDVSQRLDITCRKGDTFKLILNITDSDSIAIDLATYSFEMEVRNASTDVVEFASSIFTFDKNSGGTQGKLVVTADAADVDTSGEFVYDLESADTSFTPNVIQTWLHGVFKVNDDVTE